MNRSNVDIIKDIKDIITEYIQPAVAEHGGNIEFVNYENGNVELLLGGACSGCAGSFMTLKYGVEQMLIDKIPEVNSVTANDDPSSTTMPYMNYDPFMDYYYPNE